MIVRDLNPGEAPALWNIFWGAIHHTNIQDYTAEQVEAWAPTNLDEAIWRKRVAELQPFVAELNGQLVGYSDVQDSGLIDHFFVSHQSRGKGVARALMKEIEQRATQRGITELHSHVSITARPFFEKCDFEAVDAMDNEIRGVVLRHFLMRRRLAI